MAPPAFSPPPPHEPTPKAELDRALTRLAERKSAWVKKSIGERAQLLRTLNQRVQEYAVEWAETMHRVRDVKEGTPEAGEDWFYGPMTSARALRLMANALDAGGQPKPKRLYQRAGGQWVADVMPGDYYDTLMFGGWRIEQWIEPGKPPSQGRIYREKSDASKVSLVLGAGNVIGIPFLDAVQKLFVENEVCIIKLNPVNEAGGPTMEKILKPLVDEGFIAFAYGGSDVGQHLSEHAIVDSIHITGSNLTHDAILWGRDPAEQEKNKKAGKKRIDKHFTSELGCVTPFIIVPGDWSDADMALWARSIAGAVQNNVSFMCVAPKLLVTQKSWPLRERFLEHIGRAFAALPARTAYYPGAHNRYQAFLRAYPQAKAWGKEAEGAVPWTLIPDVPAKKGEHALTSEAFCGVLAETTLDVPDAGDFLAAATAFVNDKVWGNLSCSVIIDKAQQKKLAQPFDAAIAALRYGNIGVNAWTGASNAMMYNSFGAFPGNALEDIQSGRGTVHNTMLFDHPQKAVLRMPFRAMPLPPWIAGHRGFGDLAIALTRFEGAPSLLKIPGIARAAFNY